MVGMAKRADGTVGPVGPTLRDIRPPMHITAGMGAGKSRALANICRAMYRARLYPARRQGRRSGRQSRRDGAAVYPAGG